MVKLSEIKGLMIQKPHDPKGEYARGYVNGFTVCHDEQGSKCLRMNEEKLAQVINDEWYAQLGKNINRGQACQLFAKAINENLKDLIEVVE